MLPQSHCFADAEDVARGVCRLLWRRDMIGLTEVPLGNGRRADVLALGADGCVTLVEIKVSLADLRGDGKWRDYLDYCDRFYWAVPDGMPLDDLERADFLPERAGLIIADRFDGTIVREAAHVPLNAARRKAELLRFARRAGARLLWASDPGLAGGA